jgi:predicted membrane-bound spermidine synthase
MNKNTIFCSVIKTQFLALAILLVPAYGSATTGEAEVLKQIKSPFNGELTVIDYNGTRNLLDRGVRGVMLQSSMNLQRKNEIMLDYVKVMALITALHPQPSRIFNLGLGGGELPRFELSQCAHCSVESVEIDPAVIDIATRYFNVANTRHKITGGEGFSNLQSRSEKFDVIWLDAVLPTEGPRAYMKSEQLETLRTHLRDNGTIIANMGETRAFSVFSQSEKGYKRGYAHGIRVKVPAENFTETLSTLQNFVSQKVGKPVRPLFPSYLVAVGNSQNLNCREFWSQYQRWSKKNLIHLKWDLSDTAKLSDFCQDLG